MRSLRKRLRMIEQWAHECGLDCELSIATGSAHIQVILKRGQTTRKLQFALTPSDRRGDLNNRARLRRIAGEMAHG